MEQKLTEQKHELKKSTQVWKIQEIWRNLPKTEYNKETNQARKLFFKGELYTKIEELYVKQEGKPVKRSTIRRCVNSLTNKTK